MTYSVIYMTAATRAEGLSLARGLVEARLVACANVLDGATSVYWWQGAVQEASEAVIVAKTRSALVPQVIAQVRQRHSYDCPCVVALPIADGNPAYLEWIGAETRAG